MIRLLELRSSNVPLQINDYGKIVLCLDLASSLLGVDFDKQQAIKLSSLRKSQYETNKRMFEKLLDLNKIPSVNDICVQLSINEVTQKSDELLGLFKSVVGKNPDADHPQYAAMAVYQACRLLKKKVSKSKLMSFSNLRAMQWQQLAQQWELMMTKHQKENNNELKLNDKIESTPAISTTTKSVKSPTVQVEDYDKWKARMLAMAQDQLQKLEQTENLKSN